MPRFPYGNLSLDGQNIVFKGNSGIDSVYVGNAAGLSFDFSQAGLGVDQISLSGNWADYSGTYAGSVVTLTRPVGTDTETVKFLGGSTSAYDSIVFADGTANSIDVLNYVKTTAAAPTLNTTEVTPLGTGDIVTGTAAGDIIYGGGGADTLIGFSAAAIVNGGDVLDFSAIANLTDAVAIGQTLTTDFAASNVFIFDSTPITIADAANAIATDVSVVATDGYIVIADSANHNAVTVYHSADLAANGTETALVILSWVSITQLTAGNFLV